jgi:S1-C subfamily serine protease
MKHILVILLLIVSLNASDRVNDSIVKIYTVSKIPNYLTPWNITIRRSHGSGSIISGDRILTNAHVVANETFIEVKKYGDTKRYEAEVEFISHQSDLAILRVQDKEFFEGVRSLKFGSLPKLQEEITVYGFPMGGNSLSVSKGIVSRIEHNTYAHSRERFLAIQIDAAVNPGNSGGPAISEGKIVGVVMQYVSKGQSIGYLVPTEIIKHFLYDIKDGVYDGFGHLGVGTQKMENKALRTLYGMDDELTGIRVVDISEKSSVYEVLKSGDILLSIDGHVIKNDGTVEFIPEQFTSLMYFIDEKQIGESITLEILRDTKRERVEVKIVNIADDDLLVNTVEHDVMPRYFIYGGYVFTPVSRNLLLKKASLELRVASSSWATQEEDEVVVLLKVLADKTNRGNHSLSLWKPDTINGKSFKDYAEFKQLLQGSKEKFIILKNSDGVEVAIDTAKAKEASARILKCYSIVKESNEK